MRSRHNVFSATDFVFRIGGRLQKRREKQAIPRNACSRSAPFTEA